ncbi:VCBS repeat-containing protein [Shewanella sp. 5_MG-2023]|uniref:FG-GAP repeat domain-containing protein n=1 Tax=Shewanella sp. 5_MG-2023 TaxID=3062656 RepID=UPI0026E180A0|nr:VCBS repeat-containing protein [Shewanella sp. 5_MG-2023]MDO6641477.1 VCBS repeat-containing protein [Shewanella sp. 5_MG-2023]
MNKLTRALLVASCCILPFIHPAFAADTELKFTTFTVDTEFELTHPVLSVNLLDNEGNELLALGVDDEHQRWFAVYGIVDKQLVMLDKVLLNKDIYSFDINEIDSNTDSMLALQQLYFVTAEQLLRYAPVTANSAINKLDVSMLPADAISADDMLVQDPSASLSPKQITSQQTDTAAKPLSGELVAVADINSLAVTGHADFISRGDFVSDINNDDIADVLISDFREMHVLLGAGNTQFIRQSLPLLPQVELTNNGAEYSRATLYHSDMNFDGRDDIVKVGEGSLEVYYQNDQGQFAAIAEYISVSQPISGIDWWNKRDAYGKSLDQSDLLYRKVERIGDVNGDEITDLVVRYTKSSGVFDRTNDYEIYLGRNNDGVVAFGRDPETVIKAEGTLTGLRFDDIDNDNVDEVIVSGFDISISQIVSALLSGSIDQDVHVFKMNTASQFADKANVSKEVELNFSLTSGQSGEPVVALADINGDGYKELLLSDDNETLDIYLGQAGSAPFSKRSQQWDMIIPVEGSMLSATDINADGKDDLLLKFGKQDPDNLQRSFSVLLAQ